jgi:7-cyano-7-deazaguanine synthase
MKNAIILCSGGIDSATTAFYVKKKLNYDKIMILFFNYNQKSLNAERKCSKLISNKLKAKFIEISLKELSKLSTSLINLKGKTPKTKSLKDTRNQSSLWYVPARNIIFLSYALSLADKMYLKTKQKSDIFLGFKCEGNNPYPDSTFEFAKNANKIAQATESKPKILTPLIDLDKEDIINLAVKFNVDLKETHSCYISNVHCGTCLACMLRKAGFYWANQKDSTKYLN